jgi:hypothetical protein
MGPSIIGKAKLQCQYRSRTWHEPRYHGDPYKFRSEKHAWTEKAFLQILIHPDHCQIVRLIWVDDPNEENPTFKVYCWKRLSFGLTSSPFILRFVLHSQREKYERKHPGITSRVLDQIYVYDWRGGGRKKPTSSSGRYSSSIQNPFGRLRWSFAKRRQTCLSLKKFYGDSSNSQTNPPSLVSIRSIRIPIRRR